MIDPKRRADALRLVAQGWTTAAAARYVGASQSTVWRWAHGQVRPETSHGHQCWRCAGESPSAPTSYVYLLGQYLGDGHLVTRTRVPVLRIYGCTDYPRVVDEVRDAVRVVRGRDPGLVRSSRTERMVTLQSYWMHWPCLFPQHGPGRKHERAIELANWQRALVGAHPWPLIRGLIHSDGCRSLNTVVRRGRRYSYPRYLFANESRDILAICASALDEVGLQWRYNRPNSISVARRDSVAALERHVGPKR